MPCYALTVDVPDLEADDVAALLLDQGGLGAEVRDGSIEPMPGARLPALGRAHVLAFFATRGEAEEATRALGLAGRIAEIADQDWGESWKKDLAPFSVGRVFIRPSWIAAASPPGAVEVVLDPGMAFGTGTHPTTALCLEGLCELLGGAPGPDVLDVGTGSGLLAIAAKKLGAIRVVGTENDAVALRVAQENADRNGVVLELRLEDPDAVPGRFPVVVANILANTLVALAPGIAARLAAGGTLLLAGVLADQEDEVRSAYLAAGLTPDRDRDRSKGEWRLLALRAPHLRSPKASPR
jgi:ribosomal protein L11 methyltransferase